MRVTSTRRRSRSSTRCLAPASRRSAAATWSMMHSRHWKLQVPYLARHCRMLTFDGRGNVALRPADGARGLRRERVRGRRYRGNGRDQNDRAIIVSLSLGVQRAWCLPQTIRSGSRRPLHRPDISRRWSATPGTNGVLLGGRARHRRRLGQAQQALLAAPLPRLSRLLLSTVFPEPHSTKPIEDVVGWGLETTGETLVPHGRGPGGRRGAGARATRPLPGLGGSRRSDGMSYRPAGSALAEHTRGRLVVLEGSGHAPHLSDPVKVNLLLRDFVKPPTPRHRWGRGKSRRKRAFYFSSPIGLGHAQRDVAIAGRAAQAAPRHRNRLARAAPGDESPSGCR